MLKVRNLAKWFETPDGVAHAINGIDFEIGEGEFYTLLGPSGCGKTTTLRCVAGLERPDQGEIVIGSTLVEAPAKDVHAPAHNRDIGMVFQSYAIWPHLNVFENVAYPLRVNKPRLASSEIADRVTDSLQLVGMADYAGRSATKLSGGQQQRVALARALVRKPKLLLLDEPLSNLDAKLREHMRIELEDMVSRLGLTTLYVTHDQSEALSMSDRIAVMADGRIVQEGPPQSVYARPANEFVASFLGSANFVPGVVERVRGERASVVIANGVGTIEVTAGLGFASGDRVRLMVRPEHIQLIDKPRVDAKGLLPGRVSRIEFQGSYSECFVDVPPMTLRCKAEGATEVNDGDQVWLAIDVAQCVAFKA